MKNWFLRLWHQIVGNFTTNPWLEIARDKEDIDVFWLVMRAIKEHYSWRAELAPSEDLHALIIVFSAHPCIKNGGYRSIFHQVLYGYGFPDDWERAKELAGAQRRWGLDEIADHTLAVLSTLREAGWSENDAERLPMLLDSSTADTVVDEADLAYYRNDVDERISATLLKDLGRLRGLPAPSPKT